MKTPGFPHLRHASAAVLALLLVTCAPPRHAPSVAAPLPKLVLVPFAIEEQRIDGAAASSEDFAQILASEATSTASRALIERRIGSSVELATPSGEKLVSQALRVRGVVRTPLALPAGLEGLRADQREGPLVVAALRLLKADGTVLRESTGYITWRDADWLKGGPRQRRNREVQTVLREAVRDAVELAVRHLDLSPKHDRENPESQPRP